MILVIILGYALGIGLIAFGTWLVRRSEYLEEIVNNDVL